MFTAKKDSNTLTLRQKVERIMMATTFAEANLHDSALEMLTDPPTRRPHKRPQKQVESRKDRRPVLMA